ncbi:sugar ABC transporter ATP-binding protein [Mobiluncus curtisii]|uniref:ABC transporter, ATP-binding protein n=2 Tax=Mobiluncus curtisii TaxID=2051 RepID=D6ZJE9_MOBCV|nr:sugar ABC transporter ATP-binding protein [Mobiluncus curtisii]ADI66848.1 ABC transporter, ATP-binding protein [Mobiluncus curtisii ATCC 43063]QQU09331.1 sugar ABC transporter ATP-binding protein [Mobiluncus curtisii]SQB63388.1 Ribose import ATP-binding protein RbsA [Mobiluncus curtisii]
MMEVFEARNIAKYYSSVPALAGVSIKIHPGEIVGLVGHNGAGKSTLLKVLSGAHGADGGEVLIDGTEVNFASPAGALAKGVGTVYQELSLLPNLTVAQNVFLGREKSDWKGLKKEEMRNQAKELVKSFGIDVNVDAPLGHYAVATRQLLEIAVATSKNIKYLLLDEPTTSLEGEQVDSLLKYIKNLAETSNIGVLIVDHKLDELYRICDRIVALVDGKVRIDGNVNEVSHEDVVVAIAGEDVSSLLDSEPKRDAVSVPTSETSKVQGRGEPLVQVRNLRSAALKGVNLDIYPGEVLGIYGLIGSGRTEFLRALGTLHPIESGSISVQGKSFKGYKPVDSLKAGLVYVTEERKMDGIVPQLSPIVNTSLPVTKKFSKLTWLSLKKMDSTMQKILARLQIRGNLQGPVVSLSGGNQQKVLLGRAIALNPKLLMLDEPTKGVDIGAKGEIHRIFKDMAHQEQVAVVVVSSEEEEILEVSDRVCVFAQGRNICEPEDVANFSVQRLRKLAWSKD